MRKFVLSSLFFLLAFGAFATHNRGGEITFRHVSGYTYEITVTTVTYSPSGADRCELEVSWGDGTSEIVGRSNGEYGVSPSGYYCRCGEMLSGYRDVRINKYVTEHTYAGNGQFVISVEDPNRNYGVINIPNSVNVPFYIETLLVIDNFMGTNSSPLTTMYPVDRACVNKLFVTNAGAYDPDGDSLSYELVACKGANGVDIAGYTIPPASNSLVLDPVSGDFIWDAPIMQGEYNVAYRIYEWRRGYCIGYVTRDFQIQVYACDQELPQIQIIGNNCVIAGDTLVLSIIATDVDNDLIDVEATGEIFDEDMGAVFKVDSITQGKTVCSLIWPVDCNDVSSKIYTLHFKATERNHSINLSNYAHFDIRVIAGSPQWILAEAIIGKIELYWERHKCNNVAGYFVYRTSMADNYEASYCETGIPYGLGYKKIATVMTSGKGGSAFSYTDDGGVEGLSPGIIYSYRLVAFYGNEDSPSILSKSSEKISVMLKKDLPVITKVSVLATDSIDGAIEVIISPPTELDTLIYPGPYHYILYRNANGGNYEILHASYDIFNDTIVTDIKINTSNCQFDYFVELYNEPDGSDCLIGKSKNASSIYLAIEPRDRKLALSWNCSVPWINDYYSIYNSDKELIADSIVGNSYVVGELENGREYCFMIESTGYFSAGGFVNPVINYSQVKCAIPEDVDPPFVPVLFLDVDCEETVDILRWTIPENDDIDGYYIYFQKTFDSDFQLIDSLLGNPHDTVYTYSNDNKLAGCYYVTAIDVNGNCSDESNIVCAYGNECPNYILPNVFTPNGDGYNDLFVPKTYSSVEKVEMSIYNRQGRLVFETSDPDIKWDGKDILTGNDVSVGVYFYVCVVYSYSYDGDYQTVMRGVIHVMR